MAERNLAAELAALIERHQLQACSTEELKRELARRGEALPQQLDLRPFLANLHEKAAALNENLNSGEYDDEARVAMEEALHEAELALIKDCVDAIARGHSY